MKIYFKSTLWTAVIVFMFMFTVMGLPGCGSSGSSGSADDPETGEDGTYKMAVTLENLVTGQQATADEAFTISLGQEGQITVTITASDGAPAAGRMVTAAFTDSTCRFLNTNDGTMVTDANGQVFFRFTPVSGNTQTGDALTVTTDLPTGVTTEAPSFAMNFTIDPFNPAGTIEFVSATPALIGLNGTATLSQLPSQSTIEFEVRDNQTNPVYGQVVNFSLTTDIGGITLEPASAVSDIDGRVTVVVQAGNAPTDVRVRADVEDTDLYALSSELIISTGYPDQNSFSISADIFNPEAWSYDGEVVNVTIRAADINNNPVPDNTAIYFTTEGGAIQSNCLTADGVCSVEWRSQAPRPANGRVTILAYAQGEESFQDLNGTRQYEAGIDTLLTDLPEAFLDENENNVRDNDETFVDFNGDQLYTAADGIYNGTLCASGSTGCTTDLVHVRNDILIVLSESFADISFDPTSVTFTSAGELAYILITVKGITLGNAMPNGTTVDFTAPANAEIKGESSFTIENTTEPSTFVIALAPSDDEDAVGTADNLLVEVTTAKGNYTSSAIPIINNLPQENP